MIYFITYSRVPYDDATAIRTFILARLFTLCGFDVSVIGMGNTPYGEWKEDQGVKYISLRHCRDGKLTKLNNYFGFKNRVKSILASRDDIEALYVHAISLNSLLYIKRYAKKRKIRLVAEACEWYSPEQFKFGKLSYEYLVLNFYIGNYIDSNILAISISRYLEKYFIGKNVRTARIPVLLDVLGTHYHKETSKEKITFVYAGSPGRKDYFVDIIEGLSLLSSEELARIELRLIGVTEDFVIDLLGSKSHLLSKIGVSFKCLGRVSREEVLENLVQADFTVLMRSPVLRYAKAGFPTKVVESLASGTPVICNLTSDLGDYLTDGKDSIIVKNCSADAFCVAVRKALSLNYEQRQQMYTNARETAQSCFDYRLYCDHINTLLE